MYNSISFKVVKIKDYIVSFLFILLFLLLVIFSNESFNSAKNGIELYLFNVLPSIFPFLVLSNIIIQTNILTIINKIFSPITKKIFKLPGVSCIPIILGLFSGYPIGAKITKDLYVKKIITRNQANKLLAFTNNSGPLFIISFIGISLYHDTKTGILLFITHITSAILVGIILSIFDKENADANINYELNNKENISNIFINSIKDSINTALLIGGFIVFFSVIINLLINSYFFYILSIPINSLLNIFNISTLQTIPTLQGIIELTNGINNISLIKNLPYINKISITSFILGIGGLSIYMQLKAIISDTDLSTKKYIIGKILHGIISFMLTFLLIYYTPFFNLGSIETYIKPYTTIDKVISNSQINIFLDIITFSFILVVIFKMYITNKHTKRESN